jgi:ABC-type transporter MlaC component
MSTALLFGVNENKIETVMNLKIQKVTALLQDKKMDRAGKENRIYMVMDPIFDYKTMSIVSLGKKWKKLNNEQKVVFTEKFSQKYRELIKIFGYVGIGVGFIAIATYHSILEKKREE